MNSCTQLHMYTKISIYITDTTQCEYAHFLLHISLLIYTVAGIFFKYVFLYAFKKERKNTRKIREEQ